MHKLSRTLLLLAALLLAPAHAFAVEVKGPGEAETVPPPAEDCGPQTEAAGKGDNKGGPPPFEFGAAVARVPSSDIGGSGASMAYTEYATSLEMAFFLFGASHRVFDWEDGSDFAGASGKDPWGSLTTLSPGLQYFHKFGDWGVWAMFMASTGFEDSITNDSWTYQPQLLGLYMPTDDWAIYFGGGYIYHPVEPLAYPVIGLAFRHEEKTGLCGAIGFPETMLRYWLTERWSVKLDFGWAINTYRLADDNPIAAKGYLRIDEKIPGLHLEYRPMEGLLVSPGVRWHLDRTLTVYDSDRDEVSGLDDVNVDAAWSAVLQVGYEF